MQESKKRYSQGRRKQKQGDRRKESDIGDVNGVDDDDNILMEMMMMVMMMMRG